MKRLLDSYIEQYLLNEISKEELYNQCVKLLHKILNGSLMDLKNLVLWGILVELMEIEDLDGESCKELLNRLSAILKGNMCGSFMFVMRIPEKFIENNLQSLECSITKYLNGERLMNSEIMSLHDIYDKKMETPQTINNILEREILELVKLGYEFDEQYFKFDIKHKLFVNTMLWTEKDFLNKICTLIECYNGKREFFVQVIFDKGDGTVSVSV